MAKYIVLLGAPGAGKGTQAVRISRGLNLPHISSGDIFRENLKQKTDLGNQAKTFMNRGELVPDDLTIAMIGERLSRVDCALGAVLDGFPRTPAQAEALEKILTYFKGKVDTVLYIKVDEQELITRLSGRWTCRECGHIYHEEHNPPEEPGFCDRDGSDLYQRDDDRAETVSNRIKVYLKETAPLITYYRESGKLIDIDGSEPIEVVTAEILKLLSD
jgi:adenylate kinase